jgi:hypothetical protein
MYPWLLPVVLAAAAAATVASAAPPGPSALSRRDTFAVVVGNNESLDRKRPALQYADDDAAGYFRLLEAQTEEAALLAVLDKQTQQRHPGLAARARPPTRAELLSVLRRLNESMRRVKDAGGTPVLYLVYAGHGQRDAGGEGSITLLDGVFRRSDLFDQVLGPSQASYVHLIVDACDSYFFVHSRGALPVGPSYAAAVGDHLGARELSRFPQVGVVLSTTKEQESHEWSAIQSGVFSHQVRSALAGAADVNGDGVVEYSELAAFVAAANQGVADVRARVELFARAPALDRAAPLSDLRRPSRLGFLLLPPGLSGRMWVEDARGVRMAELNKEPERAVVLALRAEATYYLRSAAGEARTAVGQGGEVVDASGLSWSPLPLAARGPIQDAYGERMFTVPFGPRFYRGFAASMTEPPVAIREGLDLSP